MDHRLADRRAAQERRRAAAARPQRRWRLVQVVPLYTVSPLDGMQDVLAGLVATEGADQQDANMLNDQNRMLDELLGLNPTTVVVTMDSNPVLMPWIAKAPAVLEAWNQGTEDGHVVAGLLFGVWDDCTRRFVTKPGEYTIYVGNSADNTPHMATLTVG